MQKEQNVLEWQPQAGSPEHCSLWSSLVTILSQTQKTFLTDRLPEVSRQTH